MLRNLYAVALCLALTLNAHSVLPYDTHNTKDAKSTEGTEVNPWYEGEPTPRLYEGLLKVSETGYILIVNSEDPTKNETKVYNLSFYDEDAEKEAMGIIETSNNNAQDRLKNIKILGYPKGGNKIEALYGLPLVQDWEKIRLLESDLTLPIPPQWVIVNEKDIENRLQEIEKNKNVLPKGTKESTEKMLSKSIQLAKYPLSQKGPNPSIMTAWIPKESPSQSDKISLSNHSSQRLESISQIITEFSLLSPPKIDNNVAWYTFSSKLPKGLANMVGYHEKDITREYIIASNKGYTIITMICPKEGPERYNCEIIFKSSLKNIKGLNEHMWADVKEAKFQ
jgi:hypothetical protein